MIEQLRAERQAELTGHANSNYLGKHLDYVRSWSWLRLIAAPKYGGDVLAMTDAQRVECRDWLWECREAHKAAVAELHR